MLLVGYICNIYPIFELWSSYLDIRDTTNFYDWINTRFVQIVLVKGSVNVQLPLGDL